MREEVLPLLQPDNKGQSETHPIALMSDHISASIGPDPDTMHLLGALSQPDKAEFIKE